MGHDRSLAVGEQSVEAPHPHWNTLVGPALAAFVVVAALLVGEVLIPGGRDAAVERLAAAVVALVLLMWWLVYPLLRWRTLLPQVPHVERVSARLFQLVEDERLRASTITQNDQRSDPR